ncbi:hypothetical protein [Amycolatopsis sp. lyj-346]|uniref:hypothetical protein n=1 Tax=Amycolatopsis sp. lyj-346 TaxID=2789289 RepID=UPI00397949D2
MAITSRDSSAVSSCRASACASAHRAAVRITPAIAVVNNATRAVSTGAKASGRRLQTLSAPDNP